MLMQPSLPPADPAHCAGLAHNLVFFFLFFLHASFAGLFGVVGEKRDPWGTPKSTQIGPGREKGGPGGVIIDVFGALVALCGFFDRFFVEF